MKDNFKKARAIIATWPKWKREFKLIKYSKGIFMEMYTHPVTSMKYKKVDGEYYFKSKWERGLLGDGWVKSGMKRGFIPYGVYV